MWLPHARGYNIHRPPLSFRVRTPSSFSKPKEDSFPQALKRLASDPNQHPAVRIWRPVYSCIPKEYSEYRVLWSRGTLLHMLPDGDTYNVLQAQSYMYYHFQFTKKVLNVARGSLSLSPLCTHHTPHTTHHTPLLQLLLCDLISK